MDRMAPWIVEQVEPEAREAAKLAARKAGMSLGAWLSHTVLSTAASELKRAPRQDGNGYNGNGRGGYRYGGNGSGGNGSGGNGRGTRPRPPALTSDVILESIHRLTSRIETSEAKTVASIQPLAQRVSELTRQVEYVGARTSMAAAPMERAMVRMAERLERLERNAAARSNGRWLGVFPRHS